MVLGCICNVCFYPVPPGVITAQVIEVVFNMKGGELQELRYRFVTRNIAFMGVP